MTDLLTLIAQIGGFVTDEELRYQCRKHRLDMNGSLDALIEAGEVERDESGDLRAVRQAEIKRAGRRPPRQRRSRRPSFWPDPEDRRLRVGALLRQGLPLATVADRLGVHYTTAAKDAAILRASTPSPPVPSR